MSAKRPSDGGGSKGKRAKAATPAPASASALAKVRAVKLAEQKRPALPSVDELELKEEIRQVVEMEDVSVQKAIEGLMLQAAASVMAGNGFGYEVPSRGTANQLYLKELDRIVLKAQTTLRSFANSGTVRKTAITTRMLELIHQVVKKGIHITKRDLFYTDVKLFQQQGDSDRVLDDVACLVGCTRNSLNVVASDKGVVVGKVKFLEDGDPIDCTRMGTGGKAIPALVDKITNIESDAEFVLLVEKDAAFMRLAEDRFYNQFPCIIVTGKGQPDLSTRLFVKMLKDTLKIPILALVDSDPYGLKILSVYMSGSKNMSYDSAGLATSDIKWLGVRPSDLDKYNIPQQCRLPMTKEDIAMGKSLLQADFIKKNPAWVKELEMMQKTGEKAEIQALSSFGFQYLTQTYLPAKIRAGDWI